MKEPLEVTAHFDQHGKITPVDFTWEGQKFHVDTTGRHWEDESGFHILVMVPSDQVFEIIYVPSEARWYLGSFGKQHSRA